MLPGHGLSISHGIYHGRCDCFKVVALAPVAGGVVVRNACAVHEIHITDMREMKGLFLSLANKYRKGTIHKSNVVLKKEKDGSFSQGDCHW